MTELDGVPEASFDAIDAYIARHGLAGAEGRSMLYLEARCVALARAIGAQGVQNGGIDGASVAASVPRGLRELMAENLMVMMRNLESCSGNDALTVPLAGSGRPVAGSRTWMVRCLAGPPGASSRNIGEEVRAVVAELAKARVSSLRHAALLYAGPGEFAAGVASFVGAAAHAGDPVLVACTAPSLELLRPRLNGHGGLVTWADMRSIGLNPARLIDTISLFARRHHGRAIWCVQEPAWSARTAEELREVIRHEALVNLALAALPVNLLCPYGIQLGTELIASVQHTHPELTQGGRRWPSSSYIASTTPTECDQQLSTPPAGAETRSYRDDLAGVRDFTASWARRVGLPPRRVGDLVIAVGELAANTFAHTSEPGTLTLWTTGSELICQVNDTGHITDPLAGRLKRDSAVGGGGNGLWVVQQVCDLVQIRTSPAGTAIRLHMHLNS